MLDSIKALFEVYRTKTDPEERRAIYHRIDSLSYEASKIAIPNEYDKLMSVIGAEGTNAFTSSDMTVYQEDIPSNEIDNWARIEADRFMNPVIRGFHTELEAVYEEKNMSLTQDNRKAMEAIDLALFPHHPYGLQTTLGTQEHLKNPSIINIENYRANFYVPNNVAICVSGDFDPDTFVATIEKYFGDWQPNPDIKYLEYEPEQAITAPIHKEVYGLDAEFVMMGWRVPGNNDYLRSEVGDIVGSILYNGQAGLADLNLIHGLAVVLREAHVLTASTTSVRTTGSSSSWAILVRDRALTRCVTSCWSRWRNFAAETSTKVSSNPPSTTTSSPT